jgi:putative membrane protein
MNAQVYCGPAPDPETLLSAWNFDPPLMVGLALLAVATTRRGGWRMWLAWAALTTAFVSPLCALSAALFSARAAHHTLMIAVAAPLLAVALPRLPGPNAPVALALHTVTLWFWHAPGAYGWALDTHAGYWLMQITLLVTALWLWRGVFAAPVGMAVATLLGATAQMGLLGALLVFAPAPLYAHHLFTTHAWGLSALQDQQVAGLIMWVPAALPFLAAAARFAWRAASARSAGRALA